jgi:hypothetical protein
MNNITLDNYEAFFLDYQEGKLNSEQLSELSLFLVLHPELKAELKDYTEIQLQPEIETFTKKTQLKKFAFDEMQVTSSNFDDFCIANLEKILSPRKANELQKFSKSNPSFQKEFETYQKLVLVPDKRLQYIAKKDLYHKAIAPINYYRIGITIASMAAGVALLIGFYLYLNSSQKHIVTSKSDNLMVSSQPKSELSIPNQPKYQVKNKVKPSKTILAVKTTDSVERVIAKNHESRTIEKEPAIKVSLPSCRLEGMQLSLSQLKEIHSEPTQQARTNAEYSIYSTANKVISDVEEKIASIDLSNERKKFSLIKIAQAGIKGINKLTDSNMTLTEKTDSTGNVLALTFESGLIKYHKNFND